MSKRKNETDEEYRVRHADSERARYHGDAETKARALARSRSRYLADPKKQNAAQARSYRKHKSKYKARAQANRDGINAYAREYYLRTWEKRRNEKREAQSARRAWAGCAGRLSVGDWRALLDSFGNRCSYCLAADVRLAQDHVVALSRGGEHSLANVVPACKRCNSSKGSKSLLAFAMSGGGVVSGRT